MEADREELAQEIYIRVWTGDSTPEEIVEILSDDEGFSEDDARWLSAEVACIAAEKQTAEHSWPAVTDCDKLDAAFEALNGMGIIALHRAGADMSDGLHDVGEEHKRRERGVIGYCFYHDQDVARAILGQGLMLAFGDMQDNEAKSMEIGRRIVREIERVGFAVDWSGTKEKRIRVANLRWQRRGTAG